jgi:hypothetical protein
MGCVDCVLTSRAAAQAMSAQQTGAMAARDLVTSSA